MMRVSNFAAGDAIVNRQDFTGSNFRGSRMITGTGMMPENERNGLIYDAQYGFADYVVYSYATPIAWHTSDRGWIVPAVKYSVTTTRHQGIVRKAVSEL